MRHVLCCVQGLWRTDAIVLEAGRADGGDPRGGRRPGGPEHLDGYPGGRSLRPTPRCSVSGISVYIFLISGCM
jgi:hypothetical protein